MESSTSVGDRALEEDLYWLSILLNECAVDDDEAEEDMITPPHRVAKLK